MTQPDAALALTCRKCGLERPRGWFERAGALRRSSWCRDCLSPKKSLDAARRRGAGVSKTPLPARAELWQLQRGICPLCQRGMAPSLIGLHVDHKRSIASGGRHERVNLQLTHGLCNLRKGKG